MMSLPSTRQFWLVGLAYFILAALTVSFTRFDGGAAFIWLSSGLLLAQLSLLPLRRWIAALIPAALALVVMTSIFGMGLRAVPIMAAANLTEPVVAALFLRWASGTGLRIDKARDMAVFLTGAGILGPALSALEGAVGLRLFTGGDIWASGFHWFAAHGLGTTLFTPLAFAVLSGEARRWGTDARNFYLLTGLTLALMALAAMAVFRQNTLPLLFLPYLPMALATICGGRLGAIASCAILAVIGGFYTAHGAGPVHLIHASAGLRALFLQAYIGCAALLVLPIAALLRQHRDLADQHAQSELRYRAIADSLGDGVVDVAVDGTIRYASSALTQITGIAPERLIGSSAKSLVCEEDLPQVWQAHVDALASPGQSFRAQYRGAGNSSARWYEVMIRAIQTPVGEPIGVVGAIRDITERKEAELRLDQAAHTDALTGIANRRAFEEVMAHRLEQLAAQDHPASLALFDLDHFKAINDTYGHAAGDIVLKVVAQAARAQLREEDVIARVGGEEFAVLFWDLDRDRAEIAARRLRAAINDLVIAIEGAEGSASGGLRVTASMGLADIRAGESLTALWHRSDIAMYEAKRGGRNCLRIAA